MSVAGLLGNDLLVFLLLTVAIFGGFGFLMGQALAMTWRPAIQIVPYAALLAGTARFFSFALFDGELLSVTGTAIGFAVIGTLALLAYAGTRASRMVAQYPWLYERQGLFAWRQKDGSS